MWNMAGHEEPGQSATGYSKTFVIHILKPQTSAGVPQDVLAEDRKLRALKLAQSEEFLRSLSLFS